MCSASETAEIERTPCARSPAPPSYALLHGPPRPHPRRHHRGPRTRRRAHRAPRHPRHHLPRGPGDPARSRHRGHTHRGVRRCGGPRRLAARAEGGRPRRRHASVRRGHHGKRGPGRRRDRRTGGGAASPGLAAGSRGPLVPGRFTGGGRRSAAAAGPPRVPHHRPPGPRGLRTPDRTPLRRTLRGTARAADAAAHRSPAGTRPVHRGRRVRAAVHALHRRRGDEGQRGSGDSRQTHGRTPTGVARRGRTASPLPAGMETVPDVAGVLERLGLSRR